MSNLDIVNVDTSSLVIGSAEYEDGLLKFTAAGTILAGTILARDTSTDQFVPFVKGAGDDTGIPKAVVDVDVTATGGGDYYVRPLVVGKVRKDKLIIAADGDGSNIDDNIIDQLRDYMILAVDVKERLIFDNQ